jgi:hypothetical protein
MREETASPRRHEGHEENAVRRRGRAAFDFGQVCPTYGLRSRRVILISPRVCQLLVDEKVRALETDGAHLV